MNDIVINTSQTEGTKPEELKPVQKPQSDQPVILPSGGEVRIGYTQNPTSPAEDKKIHPRRPLPVVPERTPDEK